MVFVNDVMAVDWVSPDEIPEAKEHLCLHVMLQPENILASRRNESRAFGRYTVDLECLEFLKVHVNRVLPSARVVLENPLLDGVALDGEAYVVARGELTVDSPLTVISLESESARHYRSRVGAWEVVEIHGLICGYIRGVNAVIGYDWTINQNLQDLVSLSGTENVSRRAAAIILLEAVFDVEGLALESCEVNDHIHSFSHGDAAAVRYQHRLLEQVPIDADLPDRFAGIICRV